MELFAKVRKGPQIKPEFTGEGPIWKAGKIYWLEAIKDVHILDLTWMLPCLHEEYLKKSVDYISHLLGHGEIKLNLFVALDTGIVCMSISVSVSVCQKKVMFNYLSHILIYHRICMKLHKFEVDKIMLADAPLFFSLGQHKRHSH